MATPPDTERPTTPGGSGHTAETLRAFSARVAEAFNAGLIRAPVHLSGGNEEALIDLFSCIGPGDWVFTTWRSHYHCLLKGVPEEALFADILAGRSITLCYREHRIVSSAIVGGVLPQALGAAWAIKRARLDRAVWCFVGDMAAHAGICAEVSRYAIGHDLPLQIVVEDNGKSVCTPTARVWGDRTIPPDICGEEYSYDLAWPHSGAGKRVEF